MLRCGSLLAALIGACQGFYLPGVAPIEYADGAKVDLKVNKLTSTKTQLPYEWYSLPFCQPPEVVYMAENLGEVMRGDRRARRPAARPSDEPLLPPRSARRPPHAARLRPLCAGLRTRRTISR